MKKRKTRAQRSRSFRCPHCGAAMILRPASEIYHDAKSDRKLYVCHNYPACNTYVAAHPNTDKPMGVPANGNLRNLRIQAHRKFDLIWKNGIMTREEAYRWFADGSRVLAASSVTSQHYWKSCMSINRGDIFYVNPSETVGSEQRSGRPAIIVSNPLCNEHSPVVEVVYLTCQYKKPMPTHVRIESAGKRSTALCEQISSVDVSRLGDFKGHLTDREMAQVDVALMASLDLHPIPRQAKVRPVVPDVDDAALALIALRFLEGFLQKRCGVTVQDRLSIDLLGQKND